MPVPPKKVVLQYSKLIWSEISDNLYRLTINNHESLSIYQDTLGRWTVEYYDVDKKHKQILGYQNDMRQAFVSSDVWIQDNRSSALALLDSNAAWRADGPTPAQTKFLKSRGIAITPEMTKGFASQIISNIIENDPQEKKKAEQRAYWKNKNSNKRW